MDVPTPNPRDPLVVFEADAVVRHWREWGGGRDAIEVPYERLALEVQSRGPYHLRGKAHANKVAAELRRRGYATAHDRAVVFIQSRLEGREDAYPRS